MSDKTGFDYIDSNKVVKDSLEYIERKFNALQDSYVRTAIYLSATGPLDEDYAQRYMSLISEHKELCEDIEHGMFEFLELIEKHVDVKLQTMH